MARILVIDDDASLLQMMGLMLTRAGHESIPANNGREGIEVARAEQPDLAIVDIMMPGLNGYEVCRLMREDPELMDIPLLVLTALAQPEQRDHAEESGADDFVTKPITRDDLVSRVDELLRTGPRNFPSPPSPVEPPTKAESGLLEQPSTRPLTEPYPSQAPQREPPKLFPLISVMGLKLGVGATTLATNLAAVLGEEARVALMDLHNKGGDVTNQLQMTPIKVDWTDLAGIAPGADKRLIGRALMLNRAAGMAVLAAPSEPTDERLTDAGLSYVLSVLSEAFRYLVADLPPVLNPMNATALRRARQVVLVINDDPSSIEILSGVLKNVQDLKLAAEPLVVFNRTHPHGASLEEVMQALDHPLVANIPYEPAQSQAVSDGIPLAKTHPDTLFTRAVVQLARQLAATVSRPADGAS